MREEDLLLYEDSRVNRWVYPKIKSLEENLVANCHARSINVRVFNCYGPGMDYPAGKRVIPQFINNVLDRKPFNISHDGSQTRSFCFYADMVRGILSAAEYAQLLPAGGQETINIGSTETYSILELAELMNQAAVAMRLLDEPMPIYTGKDIYSQAFDDSWDRVPDLTRAKNLLNYEPTVSLNEGLTETLSYYHSRVLVS
jgi:nucleoside-diphosphate-sugar epimerase